MFYSIKDLVKNEIIINRSKFITILKNVESEKEALFLIDDLKKEYKGATQYCYAYIIGNIKRFNDYKEPSGTAGIPILEVLEKNNLNNVLCVVIRYFGGIKLGAKGLIRAYLNSAKEALKKAMIIKLINGKKIEIVFTYENKDKIINILNNYFILNKEYDEIITYLIGIDKLDYKTLITKLKPFKIKSIKEIGSIYLEK